MATGDNPNATAEQKPLPKDFLRPSVTETIKQKHAETASTLATALIAILAGSIFFHYICVLILVRYQQCDGLKVLGDVFHAWLPVLSGLAGAAATYYFTRDEK